jgi:hypothetical protein
LNVFLIILAIIVIILVLPFGVRAAYLDRLFSLAAHVVFFNVTLFPKRAKPEKPGRPEKAQKQKKPKKKKKQPKDETKGPKKISPDELLELVRIGLDALGRFRRKLTIDSVMLHFVAASEDPYNAAVTYGYVNSAIPLLMSAAERAFNVKKSDIQTSVSFEVSEPVVDFEITLTINLGKILGILFVAGFAFLKLKFKSKIGKRRAAFAEERTERDGTADAAEPNG